MADKTDHFVKDKAGWHVLEPSPDEEGTFPPPLHPTEAQAEPDDAGDPRASLHPVSPPPPSPYDTDKVHAVDDFVRSVTNIEADDYGDWMRRANTYWWHLAEGMKEAPREAQSVLHELHRIIQYQPDFKILETSQKVAQTALRLREMLGGRDNPTLQDYHVPMTAKTEEPALPSYSGFQDNPVPPAIEPYLQDNTGDDLGINGGSESMIGRM